MGRAVRLMRDARGAAPGEDAHPVAGLEHLIGRLHHREVAPGIQHHRQFDAGALVHVLLDVVSDDAAQDRAGDGAHDLAAAAAYVAARDHADGRAARRADTRIRADAYRAYRLHDSEAHRLLTGHLVGLVVAASGGICARA